MDLKGEQIKDTYGNLVTVGTTAGTPTTGTLQNGDGSDLTELTLNGTLNAEFVAANNLLTTASMTWDSGTSSPAAISGGQPASVITEIHRGMRGCILNADGSVNYYLSATNWANKTDGTSSDLTGADGNVMVEIPKFYYRVERSGTETTWKVSPTPLAGYTLHPAFVKDGTEVNFRYYGAYDACLKFERSITSIADAGGGDITVTTSVQHPLYAGDTVTIAGTTYDGDYTVVSRPSGTTFTVTAAFTATDTGTASGYVSGKNLDDMTANIATGSDELSSAKGFYPLVGITRAEARTLGSNVGTGWRQLDFTLWSAVQILYLVEYQTFYSQDELGDGNTEGSYISSSDDQTDSPHTIAGAGDALGNASTDTTSGAGTDAKPGTSYMKYRGIENLYGNCWNWADGILVNDVSTGNVYIGNNTSDWSDSDGTSMTLVTGSLDTGSDYIRNLLSADPYFLASSVSGGSSSTYITDRHYGSGSSDRVVRVGGDAFSAAFAGVFCVIANSASSFARRTFGGRLAF